MHVPTSRLLLISFNVRYNLAVSVKLKIFNYNYYVRKYTRFFVSKITMITIYAWMESCKPTIMLIEILHKNFSSFLDLYQKYLLSRGLDSFGLLTAHTHSTSPMPLE